MSLLIIINFESESYICQTDPALHNKGHLLLFCDRPVRR